MVFYPVKCEPLTLVALAAGLLAQGERIDLSHLEIKFTFEVMKHL